MTESSTTAPMNTNRAVRLTALLLVSLAVFGCRTNSASTEPPQLQAFLELMLPKAVELQSFTQPVSLRGDGQADAIEAIIAAIDDAGDYTKVIGVFQFELLRESLSAAAPMQSQRVAYWRYEVSTPEEAVEFWDRYARFYRFPLELQDEVLPPGEYRLVAQYTAPTGNHHFDERSIKYDGSAAPSLQARF